MAQITNGKMDCFSTNGGKKDMCGVQAVFLVLPCPVIKVSGKLQQSNPGRMTKKTDPLGMKVRVTPPKRAKTCLRCLLRREEIQNR